MKELVVWGTLSSNFLVVVGLRGLWGARSEIAPVIKVTLALGADICPLFERKELILGLRSTAQSLFKRGFFT